MMKLKNISDIDPDYSSSKITDLENFFDIYLDKNGNYVYNLNQGLYFKFDKSLLPVYVCDHDAHWPLVSYKLYGTTRLAWLLAKINDATFEQMMKPVLAGQRIFTLDKDTVQNIVASFQEDVG